ASASLSPSPPMSLAPSIAGSPRWSTPAMRSASSREAIAPGGVRVLRSSGPLPPDPAQRSRGSPSCQRCTRMPDPIPKVQVLGRADSGFDVGPADVVAVTIELEPGSPGAPAHRHPGPVFGWVVRGEVVFELEGEPERVVRTGDAFWEPGGDVIHYQAANN